MRGNVVIQECPKSFVTTESTALVERFLARKQFGGEGPEQMPAREADALVILEKEWQMEQQNGQ